MKFTCAAYDRPLLNGEDVLRVVGQKPLESPDASGLKGGLAQWLVMHQAHPNARVLMGQVPVGDVVSLQVVRKRLGIPS